MDHSNPLSFYNVHGVNLAVRNDDPGISRVLQKPLGRRRWHREPEFMDILADNLMPNDIFLDIGCNIGYVASYVLSKLGTDGRLYTIEPDPKNIAAFKATLEKNPTLEQNVISCDQLAFADYSGTAVFELSSKSNLHRLRDISLNLDSGVNLTVPVTSFDSYFEGRTYPTFIKMDVEGAELAVFRGMEKFLQSDQPCKILFELHPEYYTNNETDTHNAFKLLFENGYRLDSFASASSSRPKPIIEKGYKPYKEYKTGSWGRGLYNDINENDFMEFVMNKTKITQRLNLRDVIKRRKFSEATTKIARAALFVKS